MTIRTPFYFVICAEGRDESVPQPVIDAGEYYSSYEDDDEDNSSCSSTFSDMSDDFMKFDEEGDDCDMDFDITQLSRSCDEGQSHALFTPTLESSFSVIPGFEDSISGFGEWEEDLKFDVATNDLDAFTPAGKTDESHRCEHI
eukprot:scaffold6784_cov108-Cylindrotheca_fusiformis.AAC.13